MQLADAKMQKIEVNEIRSAVNGSLVEQKNYTNIRGHSSSRDGSQPIPCSDGIAGLFKACQEEGSCTRGGFCSTQRPQMQAASAKCVAQSTLDLFLRREV